MVELSVMFFFFSFTSEKSDLGHNTCDLFFMVSQDVYPKPPPSQRNNAPLKLVCDLK